MAVDVQVMLLIVLADVVDVQVMLLIVLADVVDVQLMLLIVLDCFQKKCKNFKDFKTWFILLTLNSKIFNLKN